VTSSYDLLLDAIPAGPEYDAEGTILPFRDGAHDFSWSLGVASVVVYVYVRSIHPEGSSVIKTTDGRLVDIEPAPDGAYELAAQGTTNTDGEFSASIQLGTEPGHFEILVCHPGQMAAPLVNEIVTTRITATVHQALALTFDELQLSRNRIRNGISPTTADDAFLDTHGQKVGLARPMAWSVDAYRAAVVAWMQGERHFGGLARGLRDLVSSGRGQAGVLLPAAWLPGIDSGNLISQQASQHVNVADGGTAYEEDDLQPFAGAAFSRYQGASGGGAHGGVLAGDDFVWSRSLNVAFEDGLRVANLRSHACIHAAVVSTATPASTFNLAITQPYAASVGGDGGVFSGTTLLATTTAARLTVNFIGTWTGGNVVVSGVDVNNVTTTETFVYASGGASPGTPVHGETYFKSISGITHTAAVAGAGTASVGLRDRIFLRIVSCSGDGLSLFTTGALAYTSVGQTVSLLISGVSGVGTTPISAGSTVEGDAPGYLRQLTLRGPGTPAYLFGLKDQATYNTVGARRLRLNLDHQGALEITLVEDAVETPADIATQINTALAASTMYDTPYNNFADVVSTGVIRLRDTTTPLTAGEASRISIEKSALSPTGTSALRGDFLKRVLGLPRATGFLASAYVGGITFTIDSVHTLPPATILNEYTYFTGWLGRGQRLASNGTTTRGIALTLLDPVTCTLELTSPAATDRFTTGDIGGYITLGGMVNNGTHRIINVDAGGTTCTITRDTTLSVAMTTETVLTADWTLYSRGERVEVIDITGTTVTLSATSAAGLQIAADGTSYGAGAFLELADGVGETATLGPVIVDGGLYTGELVVEVNTATDLIPTANTSDTITMLGSEPPLGWMLDNFAADTGPGYQSARRVMLTAQATAEASAQVMVPGAGRDFPGWRLRASAWVGAHNAAASDVWFDISTDGGDTWTSGDVVSVAPSYYDPVYNIGQLYPVLDPTTATPTLVEHRVTQEFEVPSVAANAEVLPDVRVRLVFDATIGDIFSVDQLRVEVPVHDRQSVVRNGRAENCTHWMYYWPSTDPDALTAEGVDSIAYESVLVPGPAVDLAMPAHVTAWPRPVEEVARTGAYTAVEWATVIVSIDTITDNTVYTFTLPNLDGLADSTVTYTSDGTATAAEVLAGLTGGATGVNAFTADTGITATALGTTHFVLTSTTGEAISYTSTDTRLTFVSAFTNTAITDASPLELSVVTPTIATAVRNELLDVATTAPYEATLVYESAAEGDPVGTYPQDPTDDDMLIEIPSLAGVNGAFRDGIAFTNENGNWDWRSNQTIRLNASIWALDTVYAFTYRALVRVQTSVIDLTATTGDWADFHWLFDAPHWHGAEPSVVQRDRQTVGLTFDGSGIAILINPAATTAGSSITINDGRRTRTLNSSEWRWVTNTGLASGTSPTNAGGNVAATGVAFAVRLVDPSTLDTGAVYTLRYSPADVALTDRGVLAFDVRAGATIDACLAASWVPIEPNAPIPLARGLFTGTPANPYFQFRATWTSVTDTDRTKLWALGAKGIRLRTTTNSTVAPGIVSTSPGTATALAGTAAGSAVLTGAGNYALAGSAVGTSNVYGYILGAAMASGTAAGAATLTGISNGALFGTAAGVATLTGISNGALRGTAAGTATLTGAITG